ncbi:toxin Cry1Ac domain D-VI-related protein, partial [Listeria ivanovii]
DTTNQAAIDAAKVKVNAVTDTTKKAALQVQVKKAQDELDEKTRQEAAQKAVNELFISNSPANHIKDTTTQTLIDAAKVKVNAVTDTTKKAALQVQVKKAQDELDEKNRQ